MENYSEEITNAIKQFLDEDDWNYRYDPEYGLFRFDFHTGGFMKSLHYVIHVREEDFVVYGYFPLGVAEGHAEVMRRMAEFICRVNYGICNGCFELEYDTGIIRYKTFADCTNSKIPSKDVIRDGISRAYWMFDQYAYGILEITHGKTQVSEIIERCEQEREETLQTLREALSMTDEEITLIT